VRWYAFLKAGGASIILRLNNELIKYPAI
jgi:hypothetical protein